MKYKIEPETQLFKSLMALQDRGREARQAAVDWIEKHFGEKRKFAPSNRALFGGIAGVVCSEKPEGWKQVGQSWQDLYYPKASLKKVQKELNELPTIGRKELKDLLNYGNYSGAENGGLYWSELPGLQFGESVILVEVPTFATSYIPVDGMIEILESEFIRLKKEIETEN